MTREEAIEILHFQTFVVDFQTGKALEMAISALRQQETVTDSHQMTNADRIRAMSDEEMASNAAILSCPKSMRPCKYVRCKDCWLEWLQQPAGEEEA